MRAMIYRNLVLTKRLWWMLPIYTVVYFIIFKTPLQVCASSLFVAAYLFTLTLFIYEEQAKATTFNKALPVKVSKIVASYYICLLLMLVYSLVCSVIIVQIVTIIEPDMTAITFQNAMFVLGIALVVSAVQVPITLRFGATKTRIINIILLIALFALASMVGNLLGIGSMMGSPLLAPGLMVTTFLFFLLSYVISSGIYAKKEAD